MVHPLLVVIAGGQSSHFTPFAQSKTVFPFQNKPLLSYLLEESIKAGFTEAILISNPANTDAVRLLNISGMSITHVLQSEGTTMADALLAAKNSIGDRPIVVKSAADYIDASLFQTVLAAAETSYAVVPARKVTEYFPGGYLTVSGNRALSIVEKPTPGTEPSDLVILTAHYFSNPSEFIAELESQPEITDSSYEDALLSIMKKKNVIVVPYTGVWKKLKYGKDVIAMAREIMNNSISISPTATVSDSATLIAPVSIGDNCTVSDGVTLSGVMIEHDTVIQNNATISNSYIGHASVIGANSSLSCCALEGNNSISENTQFQYSEGSEYLLRASE